MILHIHKVYGSSGQDIDIDSNMTLACFASGCKEIFVFLALFPLHIDFDR